MRCIRTLLVGVSMGARESRSMGGNSTPSDFSCSYISSTAMSWGFPLKASAQYCSCPSTRSFTMVGGLFWGKGGGGGGGEGGEGERGKGGREGRKGEREREGNTISQLGRDGCGDPIHIPPHHSIGTSQSVLIRGSGLLSRFQFRTFREIWSIL